MTENFKKIDGEKAKEIGKEMLEAFEGIISKNVKSNEGMIGAIWAVNAMFLSVLRSSKLSGLPQEPFEAVVAEAIRVFKSDKEDMKRDLMKTIKERVSNNVLH